MTPSRLLILSAAAALLPLAACTDSKPEPEAEPETEQGGLTGEYAVTLLPEAPLTADDLVVQISGDLGDPAEVTWTYTWSVDGAVQDDLVTDTVTAARTARSEVWEVTVQGFDADSETEPLVASVVIGNTPPTGADVTLAPTAPLTTDDLVATPSGSDSDADALTWAYAWTINGVTVEGAADAVLPAAATARGDSVQVTATPSDGDLSGEPITSAAVTILNTAPSPPVIAISPTEPLDAEDLVCEILKEGGDVDGDALGYAFTWTVDGAPWSGAAETTIHPGDTVPEAETTPDEVWSCAASTTDGTDTSALAVSADVVILPDQITPGVVDMEMTYNGYSVRCHQWDGDVCVHIQQRVDCATCGTFTGCGDWHDTTTYNNGSQRTSRNFCMLATGVPDVVSEGTGGSYTGPAACGYSSSSHPICLSSEASVRIPDATVDPNLGLLIDPSYCANNTTLLTVECAGW